jgi:hypothetical protein
MGIEQISENDAFAYNCENSTMPSTSDSKKDSCDILERLMYYYPSTAMTSQDSNFNKKLLIDIPSPLH